MRQIIIATPEEISIAKNKPGGIVALLTNLQSRNIFQGCKPVRICMSHDFFEEFKKQTTSDMPLHSAHGEPSGVWFRGMEILIHFRDTLIMEAHK